MFGVVKDNQLSIMSEALGYDVDINIKHRNPLREDKNPGCTIKWHNGKLWFIDFGYNPNVISAIDMLKLTKGITRRVWYSEGSDAVNHSLKRKRDTKIDLVTRDFSYDDKVYWKSYGVDVEVLNDFSCYGVSRLWVNSKELLVDRLCYAIFVEGRVKVYSPESVVRKWVSNVLKDCIGMFRRLSLSGDNVVVTKSFKDAMVLRGFGFEDVCWLQSEGLDMDRRAIFSLTKRFKKVTILFDNDVVGRDNGIRLENRIREVDGDANVRAVWLNEEKDISDYVKRYGIVAGKEYSYCLLNW